MKLYKVNWSIKYYIPGSTSNSEGTLKTGSKHTIDKDRADKVVKELAKAAELLGITKELRISIEELEVEQ